MPLPQDLKSIFLLVEGVIGAAGSMVSETTLGAAELSGFGRISAGLSFEEGILRDIYHFCKKTADEVVKGSSSAGKVTDKVDDILRDGSHFDKVGELKPNVKYQAGEFEYLYETDELGRLEKWDAEKLYLTKREERLAHNPNTPGKRKGVDHAGHLAGDRFGGSNELDNLVSQLSEVNLSDYKKLENQWAKAIEDGKDVSVSVKVNYVGDNVRPDSFKISYNMDGDKFVDTISNLKR